MGGGTGGVIVVDGEEVDDGGSMDQCEGERFITGKIWGWEKD